MANTWQPNPSINELECDAMAMVLEARHGFHAAAVAEFFATWHNGRGDVDRSTAWHNVASWVRARERDRLEQD